MKILVIGGSGYIGKHICYELFKHNINFLSVDLLKPEDELINTIYSNSNNEYIVEDFLLIEDIPQDFDFIINCAAFSNAREFKEGQFIYNNRLNENACSLAIKKNAHLIFMSSSATYIPSNKRHIFNYDDIEKEKINSVYELNEYGQSKLHSENFMLMCGNDLSFTSLRLFNVVGNSLEINIGEEHIPETHILPNIYDAIHNDKYFRINGNKFKTDDGTCIRSYIDVRDVSDAVLKVVLKNNNNKNPLREFYNVCNEANEYSILEVYNKFLKQYNNYYGMNKKSKFYFCSNSEYDYPIIKGSNEETIKKLNWIPKYDLYDSIISLIQYRKKKEEKR